MAGIELIFNIKNKLNEALGRADAQVDKFRSDAQRKLDSLKLPNIPSGKLGGMTKMGSFNADAMQAVDSLRREVPLLDRTLDLASNKFILAGAGAMALAGGIAYATQLSSDWEQGMAKVNVTAQLNRKELTGLSGQLRTIGKDAPVDFMQIPDAFNTIISATGKVGQSLEILPLALQASKAGFTDLKTVADASVSVINASGRKPHEVFNVLFATMNKGKAEFQDIAHYLPKIIPTSRALGLSLEQTAGSWALLTAKGLQSEQATTGLQNLVKAMGDGRILKNMKGAGIQIFDKQGSLKQITEIVDIFQSKTAGLSDKGRTKFMDSMGFDQEASMALNIMMQNARDLKDTIGFVGNGADHLKDAFLNSATSTDLMVKIVNQFKAGLLEVGDVVLQMIKPPLAWVYTNLDTIIPLVKAIGTGLLAVGLAWTAMQAPMLIYKGIQLAILGIQTLMNLTNPLGWIALGITAISFLWYKFDWFRQGVMGAWEAIKMGANILWQNIKTVFMGTLDMVGGVAKAIGNILIGDFGAIQANIEQVKKGYSDIQNKVIDPVKANHAVTVAYQFGAYKQRKSEAEQKVADSKTNAIEDKLNANNTSGGGKDYNAPTRKSRTQEAQDTISSSSKSITINLNGSLNSGALNVNVTELSKDTDIFELEKLFTEMLLRVVRNID